MFEIKGKYAYAIEYVLRHDGDLPKPDITHMFPTNHPDYHYDRGIAVEIMQALPFLL